MGSMGRTLLWALVVALLLSAVLLFVIFRFLLPADGEQTEPARYTIGEWEGRLAVFEGEQLYPRQVFEVYVDALPEELREQVKAGVPARDDTQLSVLLEDYTG